MKIKGNDADFTISTMLFSNYLKSNLSETFGRVPVEARSKHSSDFFCWVVIIWKIFILIGCNHHLAKVKFDIWHCQVNEHYPKPVLLKDLLVTWSNADHVMNSISYDFDFSAANNMGKYQNIHVKRSKIWKTYGKFIQSSFLILAANYES